MKSVALVVLVWFITLLPIWFIDDKRISFLYVVAWLLFTLKTYSDHYAKKAIDKNKHKDIENFLDDK